MTTAEYVVEVQVDGGVWMRIEHPRSEEAARAHAKRILEGRPHYQCRIVEIKTTERIVE